MEVEMSFATDTKNELAHIEPEKDCCKLAEIAGFIRMCGSLELEGFGRFKIVMPMRLWRWVRATPSKKALHTS